MNQPDLWPVVSKMLAVLTIGHTSMMLLSKLVGLSESKWPKFLGKLIECVALVSLVCASAVIVKTFTETGNNVPELLGIAFSTGTIAQSLVTYFLFVAISFVCSGLVYVGLALARSTMLQRLLLPGVGRFLEVLLGWIITTQGLLPICLAAEFLLDLANPGGRRMYFYISVLAALLLGAVFIAAQGIYRERHNLAAFRKAVSQEVIKESPTTAEPTMAKTPD